MYYDSEARSEQFQKNRRQERFWKSMRVCTRVHVGLLVVRFYMKQSVKRIEIPPTIARQQEAPIFLVGIQ